MQGKVGLRWLKERKPWLKWNCSLFEHEASLTSLPVCHVLKVPQALEYWSFTSEGSLTSWVSIVLKMLQSFSLYTIFIFTLSVSSGESSNSILQIRSLRCSERKYLPEVREQDAIKWGPASVHWFLYSLQQWSSALATHWNYWRVFLKTLFRLHTQRFGLIGLRWDLDTEIFQRLPGRFFSDLLSSFFFFYFSFWNDFRLTTTKKKDVK